MTDKEVGELWRKANSAPAIFGQWADEMKALIQKLVEERARYYRHAALKDYNYELSVYGACRDFGMDPATWPAK